MTDVTANIQTSAKNVELPTVTAIGAAPGAPDLNEMAKNNTPPPNSITPDPLTKTIDEALDTNHDIPFGQDLTDARASEQDTLTAERAEEIARGLYEDAMASWRPDDGADSTSIFTKIPALPGFRQKWIQAEGPKGDSDSLALADYEGWKVRTVDTLPKSQKAFFSQKNKDSSLPGDAIVSRGMVLCHRPKEISDHYIKKHEMDDLNKLRSIKTDLSELSNVEGANAAGQVQDEDRPSFGPPRSTTGKRLY